MAVPIHAGSDRRQQIRLCQIVLTRGTQLEELFDFATFVDTLQGGKNNFFLFARIVLNNLQNLLFFASLPRSISTFSATI